MLTSDDLPKLDTPPGHLIVVGGGADALEVAQTVARLSCLVTLIAPTALLPGEDPELTAVLRASLRADGVSIIEGQDAVLVTRDGNSGLSLLLADGGRVLGTHLLPANGRAPRLAALDLAAAGITATEHGVVTRADLRTAGNRRVWAAGSIAAVQGIAGPPGVAGRHAATVARSMIFRIPGGADATPAARLVRTSPGLLQVGATEEEARDARQSVRLIRVPVPDDRGNGLLKLVCDARGRLLGAGMAGHGAEALAGALTRAVRRGDSVATLLGAAPPFASPLDPLRRAAEDFLAPTATGRAARSLSALLRRIP